MKFRIVIWALITAFAATGVAAQQGTTEVRGHVADAQGAVLPGVAVMLKNQATGMFRETVSAGDGSFIASGLPSRHKDRSRILRP